MSALPAYTDRVQSGAVAARLDADAAETARGGGLVALTSAFGACTCPDECLRDHENE